MPVMAGGKMLAICANIKNVYITNKVKSQERGCIKTIYTLFLLPNPYLSFICLFSAIAVAISPFFKASLY